MLREKRSTPIRVVKYSPPLVQPLWAHCRQFLAWTLAVGLSPETAKLRESALERFVRWCDDGGVNDSTSISHHLLESFQHYLADSRKRNGEPIAAATRAARLNPVIAFCRWLARQGLVSADPSIRLVLPRQVRRLPSRVPTVCEIAKMFGRPDVSTLPGVRDRAILEVLYSTALRRTELARLALRDVNLDSRSIFVRHGKGRQDRVAPLTMRAAHWLSRYLSEVRASLISAESDDILFLTDYGEPFTKNRLGDSVRRHIDGAGFPAPGACHLFRHACATHMLDNGADIRHIQALLGHADLSTTQIYTHVSIAKLRAVHEATHPSASMMQLLM